MEWSWCPNKKSIHRWTSIVKASTTNQKACRRLKIHDFTWKFPCASYFLGAQMLKFSPAARFSKKKKYLASMSEWEVGAVGERITGLNILWLICSLTITWSQWLWYIEEYLWLRHLNNKYINQKSAPQAKNITIWHENPLTHRIFECANVKIFACGALLRRFFKYIF